MWKYYLQYNTSFGGKVVGFACPCNPQLIGLGVVLIVTALLLFIVFHCKGQIMINRLFGDEK